MRLVSQEALVHPRGPNQPAQRDYPKRTRHFQHEPQPNNAVPEARRSADYRPK